MAAEALSYGDFLEEVVTNQEVSVSKGQVKAVLEAVALELGDCLANGYKVNIPGVGNFKPVAKAGRKKGTEIRNPFDGTTKRLTANEPDKIKVKIVPNAKLKAHLPEAGTANAKKLIKALG